MSSKYLLFLCFFVPVLSSAQTETVLIYKYLDANGVLHLSNNPPSSNSEILLLYSRSYVIETYTPPRPPPKNLPKNSPKNLPNTKYNDLIIAAAAKHGLPASLIHAVIQVESNYRPTAVSPKGATGLMQLMEGTARRYGVTDRNDPEQNINAGTHYLSDLLRMFNQDKRLALAGYNAGENAVKRYNNQIPPFRETQQYVEKVLSIYNRLK